MAWSIWGGLYQIENKFTFTLEQAPVNTAGLNRMLPPGGACSADGSSTTTAATWASEQLLSLMELVRWNAR